MPRVKKNFLPVTRGGRMRRTRRQQTSGRLGEASLPVVRIFAASLAYYQIAGGTITPCTNRDTHFSPTMEMYGYSPSSTLQPIR